jgi:hypothetical protein
VLKKEELTALLLVLEGPVLIHPKDLIYLKTPQLHLSESISNDPPNSI